MVEPLVSHAVQWLVLAGVCAGFINATTGFGSLLTFVVMTTVFGIPPLTAHLAGQVAAPASFLTAWMRRRDHAATRSQWLCAVVGALAGAVLLTRLPAPWARHAAPWGVGAGVVLLLVAPLAQQWRARWQLPGLGATGLWGGLVGPGVGTWAWACVDGPKAAATRNAILLPTGLTVTLVLTVASGLRLTTVRWDLAAALSIGMAIGGVIGSAVVSRVQRSPVASAWLRQAVLVLSTLAWAYLATGLLIVIPVGLLVYGLVTVDLAVKRRASPARTALLRLAAEEGQPVAVKGQ